MEWTLEERKRKESGEWRVFQGTNRTQESLCLRTRADGVTRAGNDVVGRVNMGKSLSCRLSVLLQGKSIERLTRSHVFDQSSSVLE